MIRRLNLLINNLSILNIVRIAIPICLLFFNILILSDTEAKDSKPDYYDSKYDTIAHKIIITEPDIVSKKEALFKLDKLIDQAKISLKRRGNYSQWQSENIFRTIYMILITNGYDYKENDFLSVGLVNGNLDCDNYTAIYFSIAQVMQFPYYIVNLPKHSTLLWDQDGKHDPLNVKSPENKGDYYWETTLGEIRSDSDYIKSHRIPNSSIVNKIFLNKINEDQILSVVFNNIAIRELNSGNYPEALIEIDQSINLDEKSPETINNRGIIYSKLHDYDNAIVNYDKAIKLFPNFTLALINKAIALEKTGNYNVAVEYYTDALNIESDFIIVYKLRSDAYSRMGNLKGADKDITIFNSLMK